MPKITRTVAAFVIAMNAWAQMPHEVLVLVNRQSQASLRVANTFVAARQIPGQNVVYLDVPQSAYGGTATVTPEQFAEWIWNPANQVMKERGLEQQILAWVYSADFPIRVKTDSYDRKQMSVAGLTFLRNRMPDLNMVEDGKYLSKLFLGPNDRVKESLSSLSLGLMKNGVGREAKLPDGFTYLKSGLGDRMPLPNMMLGYVGEKGNDVQTVLDCTIRGVKSDHRGLRENIYFVMNDDVRSRCREWQFYPVVNELQQRGITANVVTNAPAGVSNLMGVMMGAEKVDTSVFSFAPGAVADHLTSWSAEFQRPQTKLTDWIKAGATGSAGAVVEPYSNHAKFPTARFYLHYASGCSMMESYYYSIACPLQLLLLGDPLARPYAVPLSISVKGADVISEDFGYAVMVSSSVNDASYQYAYLLDGKLISDFSEDSTIYLHPRRLADGYHELQAVVCMNNTTRFHNAAVKVFRVDRMGRSVAIQPDIRKIDKHKYGIKAVIEGDESPEKLRLASGELILYEVPYDADAELVLDELMLGEGPNRIRVVAVYKDGMEVSGEPVLINITFNSNSDAG